jgi:putative SOS response-associated peptidase YedK
LWETWRSPAGERVRSFTIVTTTPNELWAGFHDRMPAAGPDELVKPDLNTECEKDT